MTVYRYHVIRCTECGEVAGISYEYMQQPPHLMCQLCAQSFAEVAVHMRPSAVDSPYATDLSTTDLYAFTQGGCKLEERDKFRAVWNKLRDKLTNYMVAKFKHLNGLPK